MRASAGTVIVGIGNSARGDDALGHRVARQLMARTDAMIVESDGDLGALLNILGQARRAFIIDAAEFGATPGTVLRLDAAAGPVPALLGSYSTHGLGIGAALELGRALGHLPSQCVLFAIQGASYEAGADLSPSADVAVGEVAQAILRELREAQTVHEASLVQGLIGQIESVVAKERASRAVSARVWLGALSHLSAAHFRKHFEVAAAGSAAAGAELHITVSDDIHHPQAEAVLLRSVEVED